VVAFGDVKRGELAVVINNSSIPQVYTVRVCRIALLFVAVMQLSQQKVLYHTGANFPLYRGGRP